MEIVPSLGYPSPFQQIPLLPRPDSLNVTEHGSYCKEWGHGLPVVQLVVRGV